MGWWKYRMRLQSWVTSKIFAVFRTVWLKCSTVTAILLLNIPPSKVARTYIVCSFKNLLAPVFERTTSTKPTRSRRLKLLSVSRIEEVLRLKIRVMDVIVHNLRSLRQMVTKLNRVRYPLTLSTFLIILSILPSIILFILELPIQLILIIRHLALLIITLLLKILLLLSLTSLPTIKPIIAITACHLLLTIIPSLLLVAYLIIHANKSLLNKNYFYQFLYKSIYNQSINS